MTTSKTTPTSKEPQKQRLQKILANAGICSRRKAEELILTGRVVVNGEPVLTLGIKADPNADIIQVDDQVLQPEASAPVYLLLNKPRGCVSTTADPQGRPTVMDLVADVPQRVYPVGRLDYASEGMLLMTNDGDFANQVMHPSSGVRKTYAVKVKGKVSENVLQDLRAGVRLSDGLIKPLQVSRGKGLEKKQWIILQLQEGRNLEVRRIFKLLGYEVDRLRRIAIGNLSMPRIAVGKYKELNAQEIMQIFMEAPVATKTKPKTRRKLVPHSSSRGKD